MSVWFITGAGRGMGLDIAKAALAAGHMVVATGRKTEKVARAVGHSADLLVVKLDVTKPVDAEAAVKATIDRFGRIDVLVNNAASFYAGYFEELSPEQMDLQLATSLVGPMNVTRAFLPVMRKMIVNPGFFRTELLTEESTQYAALSVEDYRDRRTQQEQFWTSQNGKQGGDPAKLAQALVKLESQDELPRRFLAGADAIATAEQKIALLQQQIDAYRELSSSLAIDQ
jgi:NAD(P)-dependent dehydrogenase (short-subunit alcohol dehydrogenase family)